MLDRLTLPPLPTLHGERVILRAPQDSDVDDRLRHPIDPAEEDGYGSSWRRDWDGRRYHTRQHLLAGRRPPAPGRYQWAVEYDGHCIGSAGLRVNADQHRATYSVALFVAALRGQGLGREATRLVLAWAFDELGAHRVELEVLAANTRAVNCYLACGFRQEGTRREAELYPDGWQDFLEMSILRSEYAARREQPPAARLRCGIVLRVQEDACQLLRAGQASVVPFAAAFPSPRTDRVSPGHLVAVAAADDGAEAVVWRWYDAVTLGAEADLIRLWEPAHGEVLAHSRLPHQPRPSGSRAWLSAGLPGADWWVAGPAVPNAEDADVELAEVWRFCTAHGLWPGPAR